MPGILSGPGILTSRGILSGAGILTRSAPVDPLAGFLFDVRLQTHLGNRVPLGINPANGGGNAIWQGIVGSATQDVGTKQFRTAYDSGTPILTADGVDDCMRIGNFGGQKVYTALFRSSVGPNWNNYWSIVDHITGSPATDRWGIFTPASPIFHNDPFPAAVRRNGVPLTSGNSFSLAPITDWQVVTVKTAVSANVTERALMQSDNSYFGQAEIIAFVLHEGNPEVNSEQVIATENHFLNDLMPS